MSVSCARTTLLALTKHKTLISVAYKIRTRITNSRNTLMRIRIRIIISRKTWSISTVSAPRTRGISSIRTVCRKKILYN